MSAHFLSFVDVTVIFVVLGPTTDEQAENIVCDAQLVRAGSIAG